MLYSVQNVSQNSVASDFAQGQSRPHVKNDFVIKQKARGGVSFESTILVESQINVKTLTKVTPVKLMILEAPNTFISSTN